MTKEQHIEWYNYYLARQLILPNIALDISEIKGVIGTNIPECCSHVGVVVGYKNSGGFAKFGDVKVNLVDRFADPVSMKNFPAEIREGSELATCLERVTNV